MSSKTSRFLKGVKDVRFRASISIAHLDSDTAILLKSSKWTKHQAFFESGEGKAGRCANTWHWACCS